jgi:hypothetical protein
VSGQARPPYDPWRDTKGTSIPVGARVEQVAVANEHGALTVRLHQHGVVISPGGLSGRGHRLHVRFDGETKPVSIRPHLLRVVTP